MRNVIRFLILVLLATPATGMVEPVVGPLENLVDPSIQTEHVFRCDADCCDADCPPLRYKCKAYLQVYDKTCGLDDEGDGIDFCEKLADFWDLPFLPLLCNIFPDPADPNKLCAEYGPQDYMTLVGKSKKSVFSKFYQVMEGHIYDGYNEAKVCLKFDKYCYAY